MWDTEPAIKIFENKIVRSVRAKFREELQSLKDFRILCDGRFGILETIAVTVFVRDLKRGVIGFSIPIYPYAQIGNRM